MQPYIYMAATNMAQVGKLFWSWLLLVLVVCLCVP